MQAPQGYSWKEWLETKRTVLLWLAGLCALYALPLFQVVQLAWSKDLHSHILLIPFISLWLMWQEAVEQRSRFEALPIPEESGREASPNQLSEQSAAPIAPKQGSVTGIHNGGRTTARPTLQTSEDAPSPGGVSQTGSLGPLGHGLPHPHRPLTWCIAGLVLIIGYGIARFTGLALPYVDRIAWQMASFACFVIAIVLAHRGFTAYPTAPALPISLPQLKPVLGPQSPVLVQRSNHYSLFPLLFLFFLVPIPTPVENALEIFFQHASAEVSEWFFGLTGTPQFRAGLTFQLPGLRIEVAQECSGIRSSFVLFITSLLAGHMFLRAPWRRWFLAAFVVPLGIIRNAFRIVSISLLTIHLDAKIIDGPLHHRGGPIFFLLSLVPFFLVLLWLRRAERRNAADQPLINSRPHS